MKPDISLATKSGHFHLLTTLPDGQQYVHNRKSVSLLTVQRSITGDTSMLPWWKRLSYSFLSALWGGAIVGLAASRRDAIMSPTSRLDVARLLVSVCIVVIACLSGWLVAIPIVLSVRDYSGWRLWTWGAVGIAIGPVVILGFGLYGFLTDPTSTGFIRDYPDYRDSFFSLRQYQR